MSLCLYADLDRKWLNLIDFDITYTMRQLGQNREHEKGVWKCLEKTLRFFLESFSFLNVKFVAIIVWAMHSYIIAT